MNSHIPLLPPGALHTLGASKGCREGAAEQCSEGQLQGAPVAAHQVKGLLDGPDVLCHVLHLQVLDLLVDLLAQSPELGEGDGRVSPRAGSLGPRSFAPTRARGSTGPSQAGTRLCRQGLAFSTSSAAKKGQQLLKSMRNADPKGGDDSGGAPRGARLPLSSLSSPCLMGWEPQGPLTIPCSGSLLSWAGKSHRPRCPSISPGRWWQEIEQDGHSQQAPSSLLSFSFWSLQVSLSAAASKLSGGDNLLQQQL